MEKTMGGGRVAVDEPLVTFAMLAYNQERYIHDAVESALAQDYTNLEILFSDDCSTDRTGDVVQEVAAAYRGPHRVIVNRNERNVGIGEHINGIMRRSRGS